jgi:signal transduction histidine kinase
MAAQPKQAKRQTAGERWKSPPPERRIDEAKFRELQTLHEISQTILRSPDLQTILEQILNKALLVGSFDLGVIRLLEPNGKTLKPVASKGYQYPEKVGEKSADRGSTNAGRLLVEVQSKKNTYVVENLSTRPGLRRFKEEGARSAVVVPVRAGDDFLGALQLGSRTLRRFRPYEVHLLTAIGGQIGIAVQKARLAEKTERRALEISALNTVTTALTASLKLDEVLDKALHAALLFTGMEIGYIRLLEGNPPRFTLKVHKGISSALAEGLQKKGTRPGGRAEQVVTTKRSLVLANVQTEHIEGVVLDSPSQNFNTTAWVPIMSREQVIGIINIATDGTQTFSTNQVSLLESIGASIGIAVENARLFEQTKKQAAALEEDIVRREHAEKELQSLAAELARSNRELQDFASVASHDLQEPLRKILAFGDRLKASCGNTLRDDSRDYLERMQNAAGRMKTLINDLLTFSRVTTKAQPFVPVDLAQVTQEVLADLEVLMGQTGGCVEVGNLPTIDADPMQMRQLLQNLVGNALKFHRQEAAPVIKIHGQFLNGRGQGTPDGPRADELCQITVEDNGIGFDEKYLDRIFNVFQRLHGRGAYEGSGIGLAVCRKIAERHGGEITATSTPGQGTKFIVKLPAKQFKGGDT